MKKNAMIFASLLLVFVLTGCSESLMTDPVDNASADPVLKSAKTMPFLAGTTYEIPTGSNYPEFVGTIDFHGADGHETYGIAYDVLKTTGDPAKTVKLIEKFYIYEEGSDWLTESVLTGTNSGTIIKSETFVTNGRVESASEPFEGWEGRSVHVRGDIIVDESGMHVESIFRIN